MFRRSCIETNRRPRFRRRWLTMRSKCVISPFTTIDAFLHEFNETKIREKFPSVSVLKIISCCYVLKIGFGMVTNLFRGRERFDISVDILIYEKEWESVLGTLTETRNERIIEWFYYYIFILLFASERGNGGEERKGRARLKETIRRKFYCDRGFERVNEFWNLVVRGFFGVEEKRLNKWLLEGSCCSRKRVFA